MIAPRRRLGHAARACAVAAVIAAAVSPAGAGPERPGPEAAREAPDSAAAHRALRPELFHPETGLRIARHRAPTPADAPGARALDPAAMLAAAAQGALLIDVTADEAGVWFEADGEWVGHGDHVTAAGAHWLPEVGHGALSPEIEAYYRAALARLTGGDLARPLVVFCHADCWMSWNAAVRAARWGYAAVGWAPLGIEGWIEAGGPTAAASPLALGPAGGVERGAASPQRARASGRP